MLARLWGALAREPLPGLSGRRVEDGTLTVTFEDGTTVSGPAAMAEPFAVPPDDLALSLGSDPGPVARRLFGHEGFAAELDNSVANLALARAAQPQPAAAN